MAKKKTGANVKAAKPTIKATASLPDKLEALTKRYRQLRTDRKAIDDEIRFLRQAMADLAPAARAMDKLRAAGMTQDEFDALMAESE